MVPECIFVITPLTDDCGISMTGEITLIDLLTCILLQHHPQTLELFRSNDFFPKVCKGTLHAQVLDSIKNLNSKIKRRGPKLCPYSVKAQGCYIT